MNYTFRDLLEALQELTEEQLDMTATVCDYEAEEFYPIEFTSNSDDIVIESDGQPGTDSLMCTSMVSDSCHFKRRR